MGRVGWVGALILVSACGAETDLKLGQNIGLTALKGYTRATLNTSVCADRDCRITLERDVAISTQREVQGLADLIKAVDLEVKGLSFEDDDLDRVISMDTQVREGSVTIANAAVLTKDDLQQLPRTVRIEGAAVEVLRDQISSGHGAYLHVKAQLVVGPPLPTHLLIRYWVQPVLIIGPQ